MQVTLENEKENVVKLDITVPAKEAADAYNNAVKRISQYVNIDGFRKGKAPRELVERHVGVDRIKQEALEGIMPRVLSQAIDENKLDVITQPYITSYNYNIGEDLKVVAKVETRPEVTLGDYKGLTVDVEDSVIADDAIDRALENLRTQHAESKIITDRETKDTDIVKIDFDGYVGEEKIKGGEGKNYPLDLAHSTFIPGFAEQLVGKKLNDEFTIEVTFPEDYHDEKLKGQKANFKIKINEISEKILPELNDEFVAKVGPFKTVDDLKADIQKYLDQSRENANKNNSENEIFKAAIANAKVEIPQSMIDREAQSLLAEYKNRLAAQGISWEMLTKAQGEKELLDNLNEDAKTRIKNSLVIDKIAKVEKIELERADLDKKFTELSAAYRISQQDLYKQISKNPEILSSMSQQAMNDKVRDFLLQNNTVNIVPPKKSK
ncbi:MAG: trigger factor [Candidatus Gastranaerophilaceae bacterium]|nr:trigger factor [Candidatus Gastranaerophilaceae bacterium]